MKQAIELRELLKKIDRKGYPAYKETRGQYQFPGYVLRCALRRTFLMGASP